MTFEENLKYKGNIPLVAYVNFETTVPNDHFLDPENRKMSAVSYVIIFAIHPDLHTDRLIMKDSFGHSLKKPADLSYLTRKQHKFKDEKTMIQLKNCTLTVYMRNNKIAISQMLTT